MGCSSPKSNLPWNILRHYRFIYFLCSHPLQFFSPPFLEFGGNIRTSHFSFHVSQLLLNIFNLFVSLCCILDNFFESFFQFIIPSSVVITLLWNLWISRLQRLSFLKFYGFFFILNFLLFVHVFSPLFYVFKHSVNLFSVSDHSNIWSSFIPASTICYFC